MSFTGAEHLQADEGQDTFRISNRGENRIHSFDGGTGTGLNALEVSRDANFLLGDADLTITPLISTQPVQHFSLQHFSQAQLAGGIGDNLLDASRFTGQANLRGSGGNDMLWGGSGNDSIYGGVGNDWLSGNGGDDLLVGNTGRDVLVGGTGRDQLNRADLVGSDYGDDLLIGGSTTFDTDLVAIKAIRRSWALPALYVDHIERLKTIGVGFENRFKLIAGTTVLEDDAVDQFFGGGGLDWYFARTTGANADIHDASGSEQVEAL
jgi:Ca2+-binding RTX toxin-like protein